MFGPDWVSLDNKDFEFKIVSTVHRNWVNELAAPRYSIAQNS